MAHATCDGCGRLVTVAGGDTNLWTLEATEGTAIRLDFEDGSSHLLCFPCIEVLPDDPVAADVDVLERDDGDGLEQNDGEDGRRDRAEVNADHDGQTNEGEDTENAAGADPAATGVTENPDPTE